MAWNIVIAGGGFGGLYAARTLEKVLAPHAARITLVNDVNYMLYTPLLPGAAAGTLEPRHVVVPLREKLKRTDLRIGSVTGADPDKRELQVHTLEGHMETLPYDQLIVAIGSVSRTLPIPGLKEHATGFKTLSEAIALRNYIVGNLERAETLDTAAEREPYLSYVFVGAGYAGVEALAELQDFMAAVIERYPRCRTQGIRFVLVEARDRIMGEIQEDLAAFAEQELMGRGIEVKTSTEVAEVQSEAVILKGGETIRARTCVWTAGVKPHPVVAELGLPLDQGGRIRTGNDMRVEGYPEVWAIGDAAGIPDPDRPLQALAADRAARAAPGAPRGQERRRRARRRRPGQALHLQDARRVRRHGPLPGRRLDDGDQVARLPRLDHGPHLPPAADAGHEAQVPPAHRLERRAGLRPRHLRPRPARPPARARRGRPGLVEQTAGGTATEG